MAFDGNGNFLRLHNWTTDAANGVNINASEMDGEDNGFAAGLTNAVTRDGQGKMSVDFTPAVDNTLNLGTLSRRWNSINGVPLPSGNSALNYYPRTAAELLAGVTPTDFSYIPHDLRRLGVVGDGVVDDTTAMRNAFLVGGEWKVWAGAQIRITGTITGIKATRLYSDAPVMPAAPAAPTQAFLIHDFSGTFFDLVGTVTDDKIGSGFAFERLCFLQNNGNGTGASGTCIRAYSTTVRCPWIKVLNCNLEQGSSKNDWTWNIDVDGTAVAIPNNNRDLMFCNIRMTAAANATGAMRLAGVANVFLSNVEANLANANLSITGTDGTHLSQNIFLLGTTWNNIALDWCSGVYGAGNSAATVTATANSTDCSLEVNCSGSPPSLSTATRVTVYGAHIIGGSSKWGVTSTNNTRFDIGANVAEFSGVLSSDVALQVGTNPATAGALRLPNGATSTLAARNAANNANIDICAVDASNRVQLAPSGATLLWGTPHVALGAGAAPTFGTIGGSGPATAAQFAWLKVVDDAGNTGFIPYWR